MLEDAVGKFFLRIAFPELIEEKICFNSSLNLVHVIEWKWNQNTGQQTMRWGNDIQVVQITFTKWNFNLRNLITLNETNL